VAVPTGAVRSVRSSIHRRRRCTGGGVPAALPGVGPAATGGKRSIRGSSSGSCG
jgi:hypothetical protein